MIQRLDKFLPLLAMGILGYLAYVSVTAGRALPPGTRKPPQITKHMLSPELIEPIGRASPVDRDPFEVTWASYLSGMQDFGPTTHPAEGPATQPTTAAVQPAAPWAPPLTMRVAGVLFGAGRPTAFIDGRIYKTGSLIGGDDPGKCWRIESIEKDAVTVTYGRLRRVLRIADEPAPTAAPARTGKEGGS